MKSPCKGCGADKTLGFTQDGRPISCRQGCEKYAAFQADRRATYAARAKACAAKRESAFDRNLRYQAYDMPHGWRK